MTMVVSQHLSGGLEECLGPLEVWLEFPPPLPAMLLPDTFESGDNRCSIPLKMVKSAPNMNVLNFALMQCHLSLAASSRMSPLSLGVAEKALWPARPSALPFSSVTLLSAPPMGF